MDTAEEEITGPLMRIHNYERFSLLNLAETPDCALCVSITIIIIIIIIIIITIYPLIVRVARAPQIIS